MIIKASDQTSTAKRSPTPLPEAGRTMISEVPDKSTNWKTVDERIIKATNQTTTARRGYRNTI